MFSTSYDEHKIVQQLAEFVHCQNSIVVVVHFIKCSSYTLQWHRNHFLQSDCVLCLTEWFLTWSEVLNRESFIWAFTESFAIGKIKYNILEIKKRIWLAHKINQASDLRRTLRLAHWTLEFERTQVNKHWFKGSSGLRAGENCWKWNFLVFVVHHSLYHSSLNLSFLKHHRNR